MNIWIFNHYAITPDLPGGTRHFDFAKVFADYNNKVTIFASAFHYTMHKYVKISQGQNYKIEDTGNIKFVWIRTFPYSKNDWRRILNMIDYALKAFVAGIKFNKILSKPDIIIGSSVHLLAPLSAYLLSLYFKVPFVMEVRDIWPDTLSDAGVLKKGSLIFKILKRLEIFLYKRAKKIVFIPPKALDYFIGLGIKPDKVKFIPNGTDLNRFLHTVDKKLAEEGKDFRITYAGHLGPSAGLTDAIKAMNMVVKKGYKDITLYIIGEGSEKPILEKMIKDHNLSNNVKLLGSIPKDKISEYLLSSDALLHIELDYGVSKWGGAPNKVYDYLASGKPIIYSSNFVKDWLDSIICGIYVTPGDSEQLAEAIIKLFCMDYKERSQLGENGRKYVKKYHDISVLAINFLNLLESVIMEGTSDEDTSCCRE